MKKQYWIILSLIVGFALISVIFVLTLNHFKQTKYYEMHSNALFFAGKGISGSISSIEKNGDAFYLPVIVSASFREKSIWNNVGKGELKVSLYVNDVLLETKNVEAKWDDINNHFHFEEFEIGEEKMLFDLNEEKGKIIISDSKSEFEIPLKFYNFNKINLDVSNWSVYTNVNQNFKIKYPSEFVWRNVGNSSSKAYFDDVLFLTNDEIQKPLISIKKIISDEQRESYLNEYKIIGSMHVNEIEYVFVSHTDPFSQNKTIVQSMIDTLEISTGSAQLKVGDSLGKFTITEIEKCSLPDEDLICGIKTLGSAEFEGSFFLSGYFGEYCFEIDTTKEVNQKVLIIPDKDLNTNKHNFCFRGNVREKIPENYLSTEYDTLSKPLKIIVKDYRFDWRQMGVVDDVELVGFVE